MTEPTPTERSLLRDLEIVKGQRDALQEQLEAYEMVLREIELASRKPDTAPGHFGYIARVVLPESNPAKEPS